MKITVITTINTIQIQPTIGITTTMGEEAMIMEEEVMTMEEEVTTMEGITIIDLEDIVIMIDIKFKIGNYKS